jgi:hypothetical protein
MEHSAASDRRLPEIALLEHAPAVRLAHGACAAAARCTHVDFTVAFSMFDWLGADRRSRQRRA